MSTPTSFVNLTVALPLRDYAAFTEGVRLLSRVMGRKTPNAIALIAHTLSSRDGQGLAEDYLESIHWPMKASAPMSRVQKAKNARVLKRAGLDDTADPSLN